MSRKYAGPVSRSIAYVLDTVIVAVLFTSATALAGMITSVMGLHPGIPRAVASAYLLVLPALLASYNALFWALAGRTPAMALLGLRVVAVRAHRLSWLSAAVRAVVLAYFPIGAVWALVDRRRQAIHDKVARTAVIRLRAAAGSTAFGPEPSRTPPDGVPRRRSPSRPL
ncbi:RDD family protein [Actinoplanes sp. NPDC051346]|uniref:RDD family protein n=1 Tax=Actinoplanes sp. NPDC051346 TaxID=3155048 RepID=UPI00342C9A5C